jgi:hypothetical protein
MALDPSPAKSIFLAALDRPGEERGAFLDAACAGDAELRRRVDRLLAAHDRPDSLPEAPTARAPTEDSALREGPDPRLAPRRKGRGQSSARTSSLSKSARAAWARCGWPSRPRRSSGGWR